jgi:hypothetical protein
MKFSAFLRRHPGVLPLVLLVSIAAGIASAAVNGEWRVNFQRSGSNVSPYSTGATAEAAWAHCLARIAAQPAGSSTYTCTTPRYVAQVTPDTPPPPPPPTPVDCVVSAWDPWVPGTWSACANGTQSRTETRQRIVMTSPQNGGASCPALTETRTVSQACTVTPPVEPPPPPPPSSGETVGAWSQRGFAQPFRVSMLPGSYPVWTSGGASHENRAGGWDGGNVARFYPPTSDGSYSAIGALNGITSPSGAVKTLSVRWEFLAGPTYASNQTTANGHKFIIVHVPGSGGLKRPMGNWMQTLDGTGCAVFAIGAGTVLQFNHKGSTPHWYPQGGDRFRICDTPRTISGTTVVAAGEWLSMEYFVDVRSPTSAHMRAIVTRRNGQTLLDYPVAWTYDSNWRVTGDENANEVQVLGGYYSGTAPRSAGNYFELAGLTIATNRGAPLGPRAGFVQ